MEKDDIVIKAKVEDILGQAEANNKLRNRFTDVLKEVDPDYDSGNLVLTDQQPLKLSYLDSNKSVYLDKLARDNAQLLFNELWQLPVKRFEDAILAQLPDPSILIPREKRIPMPKPPTKWEIFAKKKGIQQKKRERMLWDEDAKEWKPRYGYKRTEDIDDKWLIELPDQANPQEDQFEKLTNEKKERRAKNELQRLRNIARNKKTGNSIISTELKPEGKKTRERLSKEIDIAKNSTASVGKFQERLPKEKTTQRGTKRKFESLVGNMSLEKGKVLEIWSKINNPSIVETRKAANKLIADNQKANTTNNNSRKRAPGSRVKNRVMKPKRNAVSQKKTTSKKTFSGVKKRQKK